MEAQSEYPKNIDVVNVPESEQRVFVEEKLCGRCNKPKGEGEEFCHCGRPTKYTTDEDMCAKVEAYLETCVDAEREIEKGYKIIVRLPKRVGLANFLKVTEDTLNNWASEHPQFLGALEKVDQLQKERLMDNGLSGDYNPTIAKLILSANHGMKERSDVTTNDKAISFGDFLDSINGRRKDEE